MAEPTNELIYEVLNRIERRLEISEMVK